MDNQLGRTRIRGHCQPRRGDHTVGVITPPPGELFSETNDNSVAILLNYGTARVLLAIDAEAKEEYMPNDPTRGPKRSPTFRNYTHSEPRFRALLTESGDPHVRFSREVFKRYSKALP